MKRRIDGGCGDILLPIIINCHTFAHLQYLTFYLLNTYKNMIREEIDDDGDMETDLVPWISQIYKLSITIQNLINIQLSKLPC